MRRLQYLVNTAILSKCERKFVDKYRIFGAFAFALFGARRNYLTVRFVCLIAVIVDKIVVLSHLSNHKEFFG